MNKKWKSLLASLLVLCCLTACRGATQPPMTDSELSDMSESTTDSSTETSTNETVSESESSVDVTESEQSEEERIVALMHDYVEIAGKLKLHEFGNTIHISTGNRDHSYTNNDALKYAYHKLIELEEIDPWLNEKSWTELIHPQGHPDFDRQGFLDDFSVVKDVPIRVSYDKYLADGSHAVGYDEWIAFHYNPDGTLCYIQDGVGKLEEYLHYSRVPGTDLYYHYENNKVVKLDFGGKKGNQNAYWTREYNKKGQLVSEYFTKGKVSDRIDYIYNKSGQLIQSVMYNQMDHIEELYPELSQGYFTDYTYDENGLLIQKQARSMQCDKDGNPLFFHYTTTWEYTYDDSDKLISAVRTGHLYTTLDSEQCLVKLSRISVSHISYTYNEEGRLLTKTTVNMPTEDVGNPYFISEQTTEIETYIYGDYYMYGQYAP